MTWGKNVSGVAANNLNAIRIIAPILASVLAACQPNGVASPQRAAPVAHVVSPEYIASLPPEQSRQRVNQLANEVVAEETASCQGSPDFEACVSARMLAGFDRYGFLASHCRERESLKSLRDCVQFGRAGIDWLLAMGGNPDTDFDWSTPEHSQEGALGKLNDMLTELCKGKPEQPGNSCFTTESAQRLGLSATVATNCAARAQLEQRGACIIDAHNAAMYGAAMGALLQ